MADIKDIEKRLKEPFTANEVGWRTQSCGIRDDGKPWCAVIPFIEVETIQERLDEVFGVFGWQDKYETNGSKVRCILSVEIDEKIITKENGASETTDTQMDNYKNGITGAFKRVAKGGFGIGRYLGKIGVVYAECQTIKPTNMNGWNTSKTKDKKTIYWRTPILPSWALPNAGPRGTETDPIKAKLMCEECKTEITQVVAEYSQKNYHKKLCRDCQNKHK